MKTKEELIKAISEVDTNFSADGGYTFEPTHRDDVDTYVWIAESYATQKVQEERERIEKWILLNRYPEHIGEEDSYAAIDYNDLAQFLSKEPKSEKAQEDNAKNVLQTLRDAIRYVEIEENANYVITTQDIEIIDSVLQPLLTKPKEGNK